MTARDDARKAIADYDEHMRTTGGIVIAANYIENLRRVLDEADRNDLDGATTEPEPGAWYANAGEFAAIWNARTLDEREAATRRIRENAEAAIECITQDHAGLRDEIDNVRRHNLGFRERIASWCETTAKVHRAEAIDTKRRSAKLDSLILASGYNARAAALDDLARRLRSGDLS